MSEGFYVLVRQRSCEFEGLYFYSLEGTSLETTRMSEIRLISYMLKENSIGHRRDNN